MAGLLLGCAGFLTDKFQKRREIKRANKREFESNFEEMKAANQQRHSFIQSASRRASEMPPQDIFDHKPPSYDDVTANPESGTPSLKDPSTAPSRVSSRLSRHESTAHTPGDRISSQDMAYR